MSDSEERVISSWKILCFLGEENIRSTVAELQNYLIGNETPDSEQIQAVDAALQFLVARKEIQIKSDSLSVTDSGWELFGNQMNIRGKIVIETIRTHPYRIFTAYVISEKLSRDNVAVTHSDVNVHLCVLHARQYIRIVATVNGEKGYSLTTAGENLFQNKLMADEGMNFEEKNSYFDRLPEKIILNIFKHLSIGDILNAKSAYRYLNNVAENKQAWRGKVWRLTENNCKKEIYKEQLKNLPLVQAIDMSHWTPEVSRCSESVVETILCYVKDLQALTASKLPLESLSKLLRKYPNLESLSMEAKPENVQHVLKALDLNCKKLKRLRLLPQSYIQNSSEVEDEFDARTCSQSGPQSFGRCEKIREILEYSFSKLISIDLTYFQLLLDRDDIIAILDKIKDQLEHLVIQYITPRDLNIIKTISNCSKLSLELSVSDAESFDVNYLNKMKSLNIEWFDKDLNNLIPSSTTENVSMSNVKRLKIRSMVELHFPNIVRCIANTFPKLTHLELPCTGDMDINEQLGFLKVLPNLKKLSVPFGLTCPLSETGLHYISQCSSLEHLRIGFNRTMFANEYFLLPISGCYRLRRLILWQCVCTENILLYLVRSLPSLERLSLFLCRVLSNSCTEYMKAVIEECESHEVFLEISDYFDDYMMLI